MGEVIEVGFDVRALGRGDRVVVPSFICCGNCWYCQHDLWSLWDNTNPNATLQEELLGGYTAGIYGYTHAFGGYAGAHAEYVRVPHADTDCFKVPEGLRDEQVVFLSDAVPTGYMGAERVIGTDRIPERLALAHDRVGSEIIDYAHADSVVETLREMTGGRGPDACIDAVGTEARGYGIDYQYDRVKQALRLETDRGQALRQAIMMKKGLTIRTAQQHGQKYVKRLLDHVAKGELDPSFLATHWLSLENGALGYEMFKKKEDHCVRGVFTH
ncbi:MAG TPA: zinc-binding dehydrogenase [Gemmatimonadaceae bacterium]|nr:zinc-binding dehydrogenase [Gemmatimonadaceae bacterium]